VSISRSTLNAANDVNCGDSTNASAAFLNGAAPAGARGADATDPKLMGSTHLSHQPGNVMTTSTPAHRPLAVVTFPYWFGLEQ
jgi:hypothetical protein